ncbi:probable linoleate 9S-lipoxygenase 5 [Dendrobium catenatum]|uniref:Lipoxygenase n=1 Tax=Dendrobium catenatum TaxID=906689 RepID=A0A2I0WF87_9ASPA|nr:probable linoleate 9S-lipoxygenase 5 [Dendrobium catenatum]PKU74323.1 putative linoleate 9S-lipoxygenase 5 [Dendrobium catenatum]
MLSDQVKDCLNAGKTKVKAHVVIVDKKVLSLNILNASVPNHIEEFLGQNVELRLVSATVGDHKNGNRGVIGAAAHLEIIPKIVPFQKIYGATFIIDKRQGIPGAIIVKNQNLTEFYLKSITLENFPGKGRIHFDCNSWVYNANKYDYDRIFFANDTFMAENTPEPLREYRAEELQNLRGDNVNRELKEWDRVYGYAYYNDLGSPDINPSLARPVLGGNPQLPYPRRGKTGRPPTKSDPKTESRLCLADLSIYVPRDEMFGQLKIAELLGHAMKTVGKVLLPTLQAFLDLTPNEFDSLNEILGLYEGGLPLPDIPFVRKFIQAMPFELLIMTFIAQFNSNPANSGVLKLPVPNIIQKDKSAWRTDEEFARETLAGVNPIMIQLLKEFPPKSSLDPSLYGNQNSTFKEQDIQDNLDGYSVYEALQLKKLFIIDHHDAIMPYLRRINSTDNKIYASRTLFFLKKDGTLKPLAIELSLPHPGGDNHGAVSTVYKPASVGVESSIWLLAKAYALVNDSGIHQLISHWLRTHAVIEPFVIATNRHLSAMHPINKLLAPHFRDTMHINAQGRHALLSAGGLIEYTVFPTKYSLEMSADIYKSWNFVEQGLPADLLKRGMAEVDGDKLRLIIPDYPYAVDGLAIWYAIETWVREYTAIYYPDDSAIKKDTELQSWWKELREVGHGDHKNQSWWPTMTNVDNLIQSCTTIIWIASAMHAAVNFGQYPYAGYLPNRPTMSRRFMPQPGSVEYEELKKNPEKVLLKTITSQVQTIIGISLIEALSNHTSDELYLGQRASAEWANDNRVIEAFNRFGSKLKEIETKISELNRDPDLKNRSGPAQIPYTLLSPYSGPGITVKGIPNSISI